MQPLNTRHNSSAKLLNLEENLSIIIIFNRLTTACLSKNKEKKIHKTLILHFTEKKPCSDSRRKGNLEKQELLCVWIWQSAASFHE